MKLPAGLFDEAPVQPDNLVDVLRWRADSQPDVPGFTFLADGDSEEIVMTYPDLDRRARAIAARLQQVAAVGDRALLLYQPSLDYLAAFMGCLYAGVVAVPAYPPDPFRMERTFPRFRAIVDDSQAAVVLSTAFILDMAGEMFDEYPDLQPLLRIATDDIPDEAAEAWRYPSIDSQTLAFFQYTSGSTAQPKGVMLTHHNLLTNLTLINAAFKMHKGSRGMIWLPPYHDMGLIGGILQPLFAGAPVVLMSPLDFLQRPLRWLRAITRYGSTVSGGPNFAYDLCVRKVTPEQKATLDLSTWEVAFNGAEPVRKETIDRFAEAFAPCGFRKEAFYPCYGLAEATLIVSGPDLGSHPSFLTVSNAGLALGRVEPPTAADDARSLVSCGHTLGDQKIAIVDPVTCTRVADGQVGEVWVAGDSVAQGYWNRPEETAETFRATLADDGATTYLRTGDLGVLQNGDLFIAGRIKDLIIIDGKNHYPQDIEQTVENSHSAIRPGCSAAFSINLNGAEAVVVVAEVARELKPGRPGDEGTGSSKTLDPAELEAAVRRAVAANHDLRVQSIAFVKAGSIPKTSSGKIQRRATRAAFLDGTLELWHA